MSTSCDGFSNKVIHGPYFGFTKTEMLTEFARYKAALQTTGSRLSGASISGQSFTFGPRQDWSLTTWGQNIQQALSQVDPDTLAPQGEIRVRFSAC
jgi:hypothetical protein